MIGTLNPTTIVGGGASAKQVAAIGDLSFFTTAATSTTAVSKFPNDNVERWAVIRVPANSGTSRTISSVTLKSVTATRISGDGTSLVDNFYAVKVLCSGTSMVLAITRSGTVGQYRYFPDVFVVFLDGWSSIPTFVSNTSTSVSVPANSISAPVSIPMTSALLVITYTNSQIYLVPDEGTNHKFYGNAQYNEVADTDIYDDAYGFFRPGNVTGVMKGDYVSPSSRSVSLKQVRFD